MTGFEFFLFGLLKAAIGGAVAGAVIAIVCLHWDRICAWFQERAMLKQSDFNNIGFSIQELMADGNYKTVYGVFNTRTKQLLDAETVSSREIDSRLAEVHRGSSLVVFPS